MGKSEKSCKTCKHACSEDGLLVKETICMGRRWEPKEESFEVMPDKIADIMRYGKICEDDDDYLCNCRYDYIRKYVIATYKKSLIEKIEKKFGYRSYAITDTVEEIISLIKEGK